MPDNTDVASWSEHQKSFQVYRVLDLLSSRYVGRAKEKDSQKRPLGEARQADVLAFALSRAFELPSAVLLASAASQSLSTSGRSQENQGVPVHAEIFLLALE